MNLSTLPGRMSPESASAKAAEFLARRKALHGNLRMEDDGKPPVDDGKPPVDDGKPPAPVEATDEHGVSLGFPKDTKVEDMTDAQGKAYWRHQTKVQQKKLPSNLDQLQSDAQKWADYQRTQQQGDKQQNDQQQGGNREQIEAQIRKEAAEDSALALLRTSLHTRGKNLDEIDELVQFVNTSKFVTSENKVDTAAVITYLDKIAPTGTGGGGGGLPGQGRHEQTAADRAAAGKAEAERRGYTKSSGKSSLLPTTS